MHFIFIVDSRGECELANATWHHMVGLEARVSALEEQNAVLELALRTVVSAPGSPISSARKARELLAFLEG